MIPGLISFSLYFSTVIFISLCKEFNLESYKGHWVLDPDEWSINEIEEQVVEGIPDQQKYPAAVKYLHPS